MPRQGPTDAQLKEFVETYRSSGFNVSQTARLAQVPRTTARRWLNFAQDSGFIGDEATRDPNVPTFESYLAAKERKVRAYQQKKSKGDWRKPVLTQLPEGPFRLKVFGDPHLDADGCNYELFERNWMEMSPQDGVYGICVGDWFNNWLKALAHLWREESTHPSDAWLLLEHLMDQRGEALIAACSGNHDDWTHGPTDPVDLLMKKYGVLYRQGAIRLLVACGNAKPMAISVRHKWKGNSMYSAAHAILRSAIFGWADELMIGGHIHQDEPRIYVRPDGSISHICQVSAFKEYDVYADVHGLMGPRLSPCWDLVVQPDRPNTDPDKIKIFWNSEDAARYYQAVK